MNYQGHAIETFDAGDGNILASTYLSDRYLVANDMALLKSTMDRLEHRAPASGLPSLDKEADFQAVLAKMPAGHATLIFARPQTFLGRMYALAAASGSPVDPARRAETEKLRAIGAATRIEGGKIRDTLYCLAPGHQSPPAALQMNALPLTSVDTLLFAAGVFDLPTHFDLPTDAFQGAPGAEGLAALRGLAATLEAHGLKLADLRAAFGNEMALQLDWPVSSPHPKLLASLDVRDQTTAGKFVDNLTGTPAGEATWQVSHSGGLTFHTLASPGISYVNPTLTLSDKHLILGLNPPEVHDAAEREKTSAANFTQAELYKTAVGAMEKPNVAFVFLDSRTFFERFYGVVKPLAMFLPAFIFPQAGDYVDLTKLPPAEAISKHLSPSVLSETSDGQGVLLESVGSFTYGEAAFVAVGAGAAFAVPMIEKQLFPPPATTPSTPAQPGITQ